MPRPCCGMMLLCYSERQKACGACLCFFMKTGACPLVCTLRGIYLSCRATGLNPSVKTMPWRRALVFILACAPVQYQHWKELNRISEQAPLCDVINCFLKYTAQKYSFKLTLFTKLIYCRYLLF